MASSVEGAKFQRGDRVRVLSLDVKGHLRTPWYIQGKTGVIERSHGPYLNPESLAYGGSGLPAQPLYLVRFNQLEVWEGYTGPGDDRVLADVFEHWLEPA